MTILSPDSDCVPLLRIWEFVPALLNLETRTSCFIDDTTTLHAHCKSAHHSLIFFRLLQLLSFIMLPIIPEETPAGWPEFNNHNPEKRSQLAVWIVVCIVFALGAISVVLRLGERIFLRKWFGLDDLFILLALVSFK